MALISSPYSLSRQRRSSFAATIFAAGKEWFLRALLSYRARRERRATERAIQSLAPETLKDIGWPAGER
ncbi:hypothetical protein [Rhizobium paknamense]|uniref:DUF1127 domain-containing protein n=1 Tax=Rhizobium paknamense TaxID=1206817 RepID=A0ABU0I6F7_9HYPH|nr:hypothetical protein [Rhizobium paknamense]MDQ0453810.1 hypothetical protein [Rhizobium paknamense]